MKSSLRLLGLVAVLLLPFLSAALAQTATPIARVEIKHVGPISVSDELIRANIRVKPGDPYVRTSVDDDVKNLYGTGFFYNIQVVDEKNDQGIVLTYVVQGKPRLTGIKYQGNQKYSEAKLAKKVTSKVGEPLDEQKLFADSQEIKKMYSNAGYPQTEVKYLVSIDESAGTGTAAFEIKETPKVKIASIEFVGAEVFPQSKLRSLIKIHKPGMFNAIFGWRTFKADKLDEGKEKLADFYRERGYIDFEIKDIQLTYPTPKEVVIKIIIFEGKPYKLGAITFKGNTLAAPDGLMRNFKMRVGDTFTPKGLEGDVGALEDFYGARGHIDVNQSAGNLRVKRVPNTDTGTMDLEIQIEEGQKVLVEKVEIRGNTKTKDKVIRRELSVTPGETFDMTRVKLSKQRLEGLQFFEKVEAEPEPTDIANRKNLAVNVEEKSTGNFSVGAGFSSVDSVVAFAEVTQGNFDLFNPPRFTGGGQKFRIKVQFGTQRQDYEVSFIEPWFLNRKLALGVDMYRHELDFVSLNSLYNENQTGAKFSLTRALGSDFLIGSVSYTIEDVGITGVPTNAPSTILQSQGSKILSRVGASLAYDTRNNTMLPDHGQRTELSTELVAGDAQFYKAQLKTAWYIKGPFEGHVLELVAKAGVMGGSGIPFYERFYLGGLYSLRGYDYQGVGPREGYTNYVYVPLYGTNSPVPYGTNIVANSSSYSTNIGTATEPIGGATYWMGSAEYSLPLIERLRFAMFYDIGMVYPGVFNFSPGSTGLPDGSKTGFYNDNIGIGLRLNLPIGPLRLDYAIPIQHDANKSGSGKFQFGVGWTREF